MPFFLSHLRVYFYRNYIGPYGFSCEFKACEEKMYEIDDF